ncbi:hypothetical protein [Desmospora profundinema]|uniref:Uncharacterized protein n=1 Tax=Desmospora profundinema TaxID=1571184 RepID=A0ABU1IM11_9BACL|nr:hypothetical protein [Desmospora profundinema]MDR6225808.1 hypothetical protein [Desmospora profundinema]
MKRYGTSICLLLIPAWISSTTYAGQGLLAWLGSMALILAAAWFTKFLKTAKESADE